MNELAELRRLLEEAHNHLWTCAFCACGKSADGNVSLNWERYEAEPTVHVRHMCGFEAADIYWDGSPLPDGVIFDECGTHYSTFASLDVALREVRRWHEVEMAKDHSKCGEAWGQP